MITFIKERQFFLGQLRSNPLFLITHLMSLSSAFYRRIKNKIRIKCATKHRGAKRTPDWLNEKFTKLGLTYPHNNACLYLPTYFVATQEHFIKPVVEPRRNGAQDDPEEYLAYNRWKYLCDAAIANDPNQAKELVDVLNWIQCHTDKKDIAWEAYSTCERVSNLLIYLAVKKSTIKPADLDEKIIKFIADSLEWVYQHIEYYGLTGTNNHIINNARALVMGGVAVGNEFALHAGIKIFRNCLSNIVPQNGFLRERSSHYQLIVTNWVLDAWWFVSHHLGSEHADAKFLENYAIEMINASASFCDRHGYLVALIGDISPDAAPNETSFRLSKLYSEFWPINNQSNLIQNDWFRIAKSKQLVLGNFPVGVYPPSFPTHGHSDLTSFVWLFSGIEILVDTGRCRYTPDNISTYQKSALGHNLPIVNGFSPLCESLLQSGLWWPIPYAKAKLHSAQIDAGISLSHNGFSRATKVALHTRNVTLEDDGLLVVDSFEGEGHVDIQICWNFGETFNRFDEDLGIVFGADLDIQLLIDGFPEPVVWSSSYGSDNEGWISKMYGEIAPILNLRACGNITLPTVISTRFKV